MKFQIEFKRSFRHPIAKVWRALTNKEVLGIWLMETDFEPEVGRDFEMWCEDGAGGTDRYLCKVIALQPPYRMVWSWTLDGRQSEGDTRVEFLLEDLPNGTCLSIRHSGDRDAKTIEKFKGGWPVKLGQLEDAITSTSERD